jgi:hypothetical protein
MTKKGQQIKDIAIGDAKRIQRVYTTLPTGITITKAWMTAKKSESLDDDDALFQKEITTGLTADGQITDPETTDGALGMFFELLPADSTDAKPDIEYIYDIQVLTSDGKPHTMEKGTIAFIKQVTIKAS